MADLECGCRTAPVRRLCSYHEGYEDGFEAALAGFCVHGVLGGVGCSECPGSDGPSDG